jgi:hypothetical protein
MFHDVPINISNFSIGIPLSDSDGSNGSSDWEVHPEELPWPGRWASRPNEKFMVLNVQQDLYKHSRVSEKKMFEKIWF